MNTSAAVVRQEFGAVESQAGHEISQSGAQSRALAEVQSAYVMAAQFPRDERKVTARLLAACESPELALIHEYARPVGKEKDKDTGEWNEKIAKGPTIHLMRVALSRWGNLEVYGPRIAYETPEFRVAEVGIIDYETNNRRSAQFSIPRQVEKRGSQKKGKWEPPAGRKVISERLNTYGDPVYLCEATNDEMRIATRREAALSIRGIAEEIIPRHVVDAMRAVCRRVLSELPPEKWIARTLELFAELKLGVPQLEEYLGHKIEASTKEELKDLAGIATSMRDQELTWRDVMEARNPEGSAEAADAVARQKLALLAKPDPKKEAPEAPKTEAAVSEGPVTPAQAEELTNHAKPLDAAKQKEILDAYGAENWNAVPAAHFAAARADILKACTKKGKSAERGALFS